MIWYGWCQSFWEYHSLESLDLLDLQIHRGYRLQSQIRVRSSLVSILIVLDLWLSITQAFWSVTWLKGKKDTKMVWMGGRDREKTYKPQTHWPLIWDQATLILWSHLAKVCPWATKGSPQPRETSYKSSVFIHFFILMMSKALAEKHWQRWEKRDTERWVRGWVDEDREDRVTRIDRSKSEDHWPYRPVRESRAHWQVCVSRGSRSRHQPTWSFW